MAQISEILQIEQERTLDTCNVIHLFQEGNFFRAYEWSAWLCTRFISPFKVTHRPFKNIESSVAFIGFPITSLEKKLNDKVTVADVDDKRKDISITMDLSSLMTTLDEMQKDYEAWKVSIPLLESNSKTSTSEIAPASTSNVSLTGIMRRILAFPLENKTPLQCMTFIAETKQQLSAII